MGQQRRQFSPEFKADAVALVRSTGRPIAAIAHELGIGESNLSHWLKKDEESVGRARATRPDLPHHPAAQRQRIPQILSMEMIVQPSPSRAI